MEAGAALYLLFNRCVNRGSVHKKGLKIDPVGLFCDGMVQLTERAALFSDQRQNPADTWIHGDDRDLRRGLARTVVGLSFLLVPAPSGAPLGDLSSTSSIPVWTAGPQPL